MIGLPRTILKVPGLDKAPESFRSALADMAERNGWDADAIAAVMSVESARTYAADAGWEQWQPSRTATGLIQFIESTAKSLGVEPVSVAGAHPELFDRGQGKSWATWRLMGMSAIDQLDLVEKYFKRAFDSRRAQRPVDYYLAVFGAAPGLPSDTVIARAGEARYDLNKGLDQNKDGVLRVSDFESLMGRLMSSNTRLPAPRSSSSGFPGSTAGPSATEVFVGALLAFLPALIWKVRNHG